MSFCSRFNRSGPRLAESGRPGRRAPAVVRAPLLAAWSLIGCLACASVPTAPPSATPAAPPPAATPAPGQATTAPQTAKSAPAGQAGKGEGAGTTPSPDERPSESASSEPSIPAAGAGEGGAALIVPSGATSDDTTHPAQKNSGLPAGQGGAAPPAAAPKPSPAPSPPAGGGPASLTLSVDVPAQAPRIGEILTVEIAATATGGVVDAPLHLLYDPAQLRFLEASEGDYMKQDGVATVFLVNGQSRPGDVLIGVGRTDRSRGAVGSGTLCRVRFKVLSAGTARLAIGSAMAWAIDGSLLPVTSGDAEIQILP
jgi:hypothetical protein